MSKLNVLYQFNEKYVPYAGVSIVSLLENNKLIDEVVIYVLVEDVSQKSMQKLKEQVEQYERKICFIDTRELVEKMKTLGIPEYRGSYATNMKMFIADYIDESVDRLLYIDSDTIVCGDISPLITLDMKDKPIAMVLDSLGNKHKQLIGLDKKDMYFNAGIILFDIKKWRQEECTQKILEHVKKVRSHYMSPDQDLLNVVLYNNIMKLDIAYNLQPIHSVYSYSQFFKFFGQKNYYPPEEINNAVRQPKILHTFRYLGEFPWHKDTLHPHTSYFDRYMAISLWKDYEKQITEQNGIVFRIERWLYRHLSKMVFLLIFKVNYDYFIWKSNQDSLRQINNKNM